jgi:hypothetical protein
MSHDPPPLAIIPVYKDYEQRDRCVAAMTKQTVPVEVFEHDNTTNNIGFTKAANLGLREAHRRGCRFAMVINQDCYAEPDAVERLIELMDAHPSCAIAGPMQVAAETPDAIVHTGCIVAYPFGRHRGGGSRTKGDFSQDEQVPWVNGACMFARMDAVLEFGLMDENMFLIGSDSDWCLTARLRGWEVWYSAKACVLHEGGVTTALPAISTQRIFQNDMDYFRRKWVGTVAHRLLDRPMNVSRFNEPLPQVVQRAVGEQTAGRLLEAEILYRDILDVDPNNVDALNLLGLITLHYGWVVAAHDYFAKAVALAPQFSILHAHLATALEHMAQPEDARREFNEAARLENASPQPLDAYAQELAKMGFADDAAGIRAKAAALRQAKPGIFQK